MMIDASVTSVLKAGLFPIWGAGRRTEWEKYKFKFLQQFILLSADLVFLLILTGDKICVDALAELVVQVRVQGGSVLGVRT